MIVGERGADLIKGNGCNLVCPDGVVDVELGIAGDFIVSPDEIGRLIDTESVACRIFLRVQLIVESRCGARLMVAKKDKDNRSADIAELVDKILEVPVGRVDAGKIGVERAIGALAGSLDPIVCQLFGGNGAIVVAAVILHRDVKDELRRFVGSKQVEYLVVGGVVAYAGMVTGRTFEIAD